MRIGIDGRLWNETGVGRYIRNLVKELQVLDKENEYILFVLSKDYEQVKFQISNFKFQIKKVDIRWHTVEEQVKLSKILNTENLDLMHFPYFSVPVRYNKPFVITIHDLILNHFPTGKASTLPLPLYQIKRLGYDFVLSTAVKKAKKIIVPLNAVRDDLVKTMNVSKNKIVVTYEGVDLSLRANKESEAISKKIATSPTALRNDKVREKYFLYVGNAYPHKNIDRMIEAFSLFRNKQNESINLIMVGKDDYFYKKIQEKISKENLSNIIIKNNVNDEELAEFYKNAIALIAPSLMEGFGLPVLEAIASGCLVLASDIPSFKEVCEDCVIYFDPLSIKDMKEKICFAVNINRQLKEKLVGKGLGRAKEFSWKKMSMETLKVYESCISL